MLSVEGMGSDRQRVYVLRHSHLNRIACLVLFSFFLGFTRLSPKD